MRISSSSSFLLASLASSSSLSALAAPIGEPISRAVASNAPPMSLQALPSSHDIADGLESRDLEERLDLASAVKPLPIVGDPLANLLTTIGLGPAPTASEEDIDAAMQEMETEIMSEMQAAFGEASIASLPADLNGTLLGVVGGGNDSDDAGDDSLSNQALDDLPPLPAGITPPPGISEQAFLVQQALSGAPLPSGVMPPQAVVTKIPQRRRPADPTQPPPRRQLGHEGSGQAASPPLPSPWSPDPSAPSSSTATASASATPSAAFDAAGFPQSSVGPHSASHSARPTATFPLSFVRPSGTSSSASTAATGRVIQAAAMPDSKDGRPWWSPSRRATQVRAVYEALEADGLASPNMPTQPPNTPMMPSSGEA
ncbi:hypothetical protein PENSPDRAFT_427287 [Peniophora sp. CONT]|nr:hypothetical protein PENSPDRAFT_427287 [Peniophora sp. CONT]